MCSKACARARRGEDRPAQDRSFSASAVAPAVADARDESARPSPRDEVGAQGPQPDDKTKLTSTEPETVFLKRHPTALARTHLATLGEPRPSS